MAGVRAGAAAPHAQRPLTSFEVYETRSRYYLVGCTADRQEWRVLKVSRERVGELVLEEDRAVYSREEVARALAAVREAHRCAGGLQLTCRARALVGFVRFLGPHYAVMATEARRLGAVAGHDVYEVAGVKLVAVPEPGAAAQRPLSSAEEKAERRYVRTFGMVDLSKPGFIFSDTYPLAAAMQNSASAQGEEPFASRWVWNAHLAAEARRQLEAPERWLRPLVHGHFASTSLRVFGRPLRLTLIARRSRIFAGTRYLKRGVSDGGFVANDVETEQILEVEGASGAAAIASFVQVRGSIPLFWGQETSPLSPKPDIVLQRADPLYRATRRHYDDLEARYGQPVVSLSLIKSHERRERELLLQREFAAAVAHLNSCAAELSRERLLLLHWDMAQYARRRERDVVSALMPVAAAAVDRTRLFTRGARRRPPPPGALAIAEGDLAPRPPSTPRIISATDWRQRGVLRTNCIDCLDRTNVAQFVLGVAALRVQLWAVGVTDLPDIDQSSAAVNELMTLYEGMGNALAMQYGGSDAHQMVFQRIKGEWATVTRSRDVLTSLRRFYSNTYTDAEKQDAINLFLGNFVPARGAPDLWQFDSDWYLHRNSGSEQQVGTVGLASARAERGVEGVEGEVEVEGEGRDADAAWDLLAMPSTAASDAVATRVADFVSFDACFASQTVATTRLYADAEERGAGGPRRLFSLGLIAGGGMRGGPGGTASGVVSPGGSGSASPAARTPGTRTPGARTPGAVTPGGRLSGGLGGSTPRRTLWGRVSGTASSGGRSRRSSEPLSPASFAEGDAETLTEAQTPRGAAVFDAAVFPVAARRRVGSLLSPDGLDVELCADRDAYGHYLAAASAANAAGSFCPRSVPAESLCTRDMAAASNDFGAHSEAMSLLSELWLGGQNERDIGGEYAARAGRAASLPVVADVSRSGYAYWQQTIGDVSVMCTGVFC